MGIAWVKIFKWGMFVLLVIFLAWRMLAVNLSQLILKYDGPSDAVRSLAWAPDNPRALFLVAQGVSKSDPERARRMLDRAILNFPVDGEMLVGLGLFLEEKGDIDGAIRAMGYADRLAPARIRVQADIALFWGRRANRERYLTHLVRVMSLRRENLTKLYPIVLGLVDDPASASLVRKVLSRALAEQKTYWWAGFFGYANRRAKNLDTLRLLYNIRKQSPGLRDSRERDVFIARLEKAEKWVEAYFVWLNSLDKDHLSRLANIYNGDFEYALANAGFGWRFPHQRSVDVAVTTTQGATGHGALRIAFADFQGATDLLSQQMLLPAGSYRLDGRIRSDGLRTDQGVVWRLQCLSKAKKLLWESESFKGAGQWRGFSGRIDVPTENCQAQRLYLALADADSEQQGVTGVLWFDNLSIRNVE